MTKKLGNYKSNDIELCTTTSGRIGEKTAMALMDHRVPFTKTKRRIPFYKRFKNDKTKDVWVITINPRQYSDARRVIDGMDMFYKERLVVSNY